ncbi:MAG: hypothetical protein HFG55_08010 [Lachnospiraceae bacterium]|nr:hypothetical protein [Lachnospiraceae bacterium]
MNVKTMEGLAGASASMQMISTPMSVADEAERKGDTDKMQRALGYAAELTEQAKEYGEKTAQGMKTEAKEEKEKEKQLQEALTEARSKEREEQEKQLEAKRQEKAGLDTAEISEAGKTQVEMAGQVFSMPADSGQNTVYGKSGEAVEAVSETGDHVDVSA